MIYYDSESIKYSPYTSVIIMPNKSEHVMSFWKITYTLTGSSVSYTDGVKLVLDEAIILIIRPGDIHQTFSYSDENYKHRDIYIQDEDMKRLCAVLAQNPYEKLIKGSVSFSVSHLNITFLESILNQFPVNSLLKNDYLTSLHSTVVLNVLTMFLENEANSYNKPSWLIELANRIQKEEYIQNNVQFMIKDIPYSHGYICREFKKYYQTTLSDFLTKAKIVHSSTLLMDKTNSVADIAYNLGFSSQSSYIKSFKRYFGRSPGAYRKEELKNKSLSPTSIWGRHGKR